MSGRQRGVPEGRLRAVVFDLDGVLLDTETINVRAASEAFAALGHPLASEDAAAIVGRHPVDYLPELMRRRGLPEELAASLGRDQSARYARLWREEARLLPGAREALAAARRRSLRVGLATSSGRAGVEEALDRFALRAAFDLTLTKDDVAARKPDPEIYTTAASRLGIEPAAMLVVEDSEYGVRSAKGAGARCVALRSPHTPIERIDGADAVIDSLEELPALF